MNQQQQKKGCFGELLKYLIIVAAALLFLSKCSAHFDKKDEPELPAVDRMGISYEILKADIHENFPEYETECTNAMVNGYMYHYENDGFHKYIFCWPSYKEDPSFPVLIYRENQGLTDMVFYNAEWTWMYDFWD